MHGVQEAAQPGDVVLLDLLESSDKGRRTGQWLNFAHNQPAIGWLRKADMGGPDGERLGAWLLPYRRAWLLLQATDEGDSASTTEAWLNRWAFAGRRWWVGDQRVVEYLLPAPESGPQPGVVEMSGPYDFGGAAVLDRARIVVDAGRAAVRLSLHWQRLDAVEQGDARYSVQALDANGQVLAQVDAQPGSLEGAQDRIGLWLPPGADRLILKLYLARDGSVLPASAPGATAPADFLPLKWPDESAS
jgi:hypothetical protein